MRGMASGVFADALGCSEFAFLLCGCAEKASRQLAQRQTSAQRHARTHHAYTHQTQHCRTHRHTQARTDSRRHAHRHRHTQTHAATATSNTATATATATSTSTPTSKTTAATTTPTPTPKTAAATATAITSSLSSSLAPPPHSQQLSNSLAATQKPTHTLPAADDPRQSPGKPSVSAGFGGCRDGFSKRGKLLRDGVGLVLVRAAFPWQAGAGSAWQAGSAR